MKLSGICFTKNGAALALRIRSYYEQQYETMEQSWAVKARWAEEEGISGLECLSESTAAWTGKHFQDSELLIFIGATGIAVRSLAPYVESKKKDPAVLVLDEKGTFCIPLLSGHIGGANAFAIELAKVLGAVPVLTTATDVNGLFAVDVFAVKHDMKITDMTLAKEVSAALVAGEQVGVFSDFVPSTLMPSELVWEYRDTSELPIGIVISPYRNRSPFQKNLHLIPPCLTVGIGCRKDTPKEKIRTLFEEVLSEHGLCQEAVSEIVSIDLKKQETGLLSFSEELGVPFRTFSAAVLSQVEGEFTPSEFVSSITGVDNVCERSAVAGSKGTLIVKKTGRDGVTCAVALQNRRISFE